MENKNSKIDFADYLKALQTVGAEEFIIPTNLTKKRALYLLTIMEKVGKELEWFMDVNENDSESYDTYQSGIQWVKNQIFKRYSRAELSLQ
ncbi:hypothetical protein QX233_08745 [Chryseobacterium gambrini]|uniref:Uncharacterized protein n=1 Tax=Chryseobacterium gambrini TaxID=373672 RepID=A0AAJ1VJK4_9FLAO|nr:MULTISPECIES: hypothetical protein [Chryseobacterium]MDN4012543.1 hypothetical protein [Chryseobacterium gambrini]QWA37298.1 hypothetical protein KKI44_15335 [Chryseobacterium sp. ZHDP1]